MSTKTPTSLATPTRRTCRSQNPYKRHNNGGYDAFVTQLGTAVSLSINGVLTLGTNQAFISAGNQATFTYTVTNNGPDLANNITVTGQSEPSDHGSAADICFGQHQCRDLRRRLDQCHRELQPALAAGGFDGDRHDRGNAHAEQQRESSHIQRRYGAGDWAGQHCAGADLGAGADVGLQPATSVPATAACQWRGIRPPIRCNSHPIPSTRRTLRWRARACLRGPRATSRTTRSRCRVRGRPH